MNSKIFVSDLKNQSKLLDDLILQLNHKDKLNREDLETYDATTKNIEKRLRTLRVLIREKMDHQ